MRGATPPHPLLGAIFGIFTLLMISCSPNTDPRLTMRLATTTSTASSGFLDHLLPEFERDTGIHVDFIPVGTGRALKYGREGEVDVVLVHAPLAEEEFVTQGFGIERVPVMWNDFVIVGPSSDRARLEQATGAQDALRRIAASGCAFVSRGDDSGTHRKERLLWNESGIEPRGAWYLDAGQGMGPCLLMTDEKEAYTLTDRGTFLAMRAGLDLTIVFEGDPLLKNPYAMIAVNPTSRADTQHTAAEELIQWLTSPRGRALIAGFRIDGEPLFRLFENQV